MADGLKTFEFDAEYTDKTSDDIVIGEFKLRGETFKIRALQDTAVAVLVHKTKSGRNDIILAAVLDFTEKALVEESAKRFADLALDPVNGLKMEHVVEVFNHILGVVSANPIGSPGASSTAPRKTGSGSRVSTRSKTAAAL